MSEHTNRKSSTKDFDFKSVISLYLSKWKWFVIGFFLAFFLAFVYLRYATRQFESNTLIRLVSLKNNPSPEEALLGELGLVYGGDKLHTDEIQIITSRSLVEEVIRDLEFNIQQYSEGSLKDKELFETSPLKINLFVSDTITKPLNHYFEVSINSDSEFNYLNEYEVETTHLFGSDVYSPVGKIVLTPSNVFDLDKWKGVKIKVFIRPVSSVTESYRTRLYAYSYNDKIERSNMIRVGVTDPVPEKAALFVNKLIEKYNERSVENKTRIAQSTYQFIDERITGIANDLNKVDSEKERFKVGNMLTDLTSEAGLYIQAEAANESELIKIGTALSTVNYMSQLLENQEVDTFGIIPSNLVLDDPSINSIASEYNRFVLDRDRMLRNSGVNNPVIQQLNARLRGLKSSLIQSLKNLDATLKIRQSNLRRQSQELEARISDVPGQERENRDIQRQQNIKESIYLYLLQKREESAITMNSANPDAEIIDRAVVSDRPISPKANLIYIASGVLGLFIPFALIFLGDLLNTKINSKRDLDDIKPQVRVVGELPVIEVSNEHNEKGTAFAEALRVLRTNLNFILKKDTVLAKTIFVTSSINGEGKSFISYHLAKVYAFTNRKVLLVGADIRKPNLHEFINIKGPFGFSDYLNGDVTLNEVIHADAIQDNLHILHSGSIPPNPSELLLGNRTKELFDTLKTKYDYIIVDTAPTMLVTDTLLLGRYADQTLYVIRADYSDKNLLYHISELAVDKKLPLMSLVLNGAKSESVGYSKKYNNTMTYGKADKKAWFKSVWERFSTLISL